MEVRPVKTCGGCYWFWERENGTVDLMPLMQGGCVIDPVVQRRDRDTPACHRFQARTDTNTEPLIERADNGHEAQVCGDDVR